MKKSSHPISTYKFNSIFLKTFGLLIVLTVIISLVFFTLSSKILFDNQKEKIYFSNLNMLSKTADSIDLIFSYLEQTVNSTSKNRYIINAAIVPGLNQWDRNFNIIKILEETAEKNKLIKNILLYIPTDGSTYSSENIAANLTDFHDKAMIEQYDDTVENMNFISNGDEITNIYTYDGRIFLVKNLPFHNNRLGTLFFEISSGEIMELVQGEEIDPSSMKEIVHVYDDQNNVVFSKHDLKIPQSVYASPRMGSFEAERFKIDTTYYYYRSAYSHWLYVCHQSSLPFAVYKQKAAQMIFPALLALFLVSLCFSFYITQSIYLPIRKLMNSVASSGRPKTTGSKVFKNEIDFLNSSFSDAVTKENHLSGIIENMAPIIIENLFEELLLGKPINKEAVYITLESSGNLFDPQDYYIVLSITSNMLSNKQFTNIESRLYLMGIKNIIMDCLEASTGKAVCILLNDNHIAVVLSSGKDMSISQIKRNSMNLTNSILEKSKESLLPVVIGESSVFNGIMNLNHFYKEASVKMNYQIYLENNLPGKIEISIEDDKVFDKFYHSQNLRLFIEKLIEGNSAEGSELLQMTIRQFFEGSETDAENRTLENFVDLLLEVVANIQLPGVQKELFLQLSQQKNNIHQVKSGSVRDAAMEIGRHIATYIEQYNSSHHHKLVVKVIEYIEKNYSDAGMSLSTAAAHVDLSPPYLSKIFNQYKEEKFIDYLNRVRIERAKQLLTIQSLNIKEIGFKTGFNSVQNFIRVFKRNEGMTPGQFRSSLPE